MSLLFLFYSLPPFVYKIARKITFMTKMYTTFEAHALPPVLREDIRANTGGLSHLQLHRVLQPPLQRRGCPSAFSRVQATAGPVALEYLGHVLPGPKDDHAETVRGSYETEGTPQESRKCVEDLCGESVSRG